MPRYELSIKASYLPGWGVYEGIRELVQNAKDAEVQFDAPMTVKFAKRRRNGDETGGILIVNEGCTLPIQSLLIGHTTKGGDNRLIGKFGEGLKFGVLALLRMGVEVKIRNGSEVWMPKIDWSKQYDADVLVFDVTRGHADNNRVQVEVVGVTDTQWEDIKSKLLFLGKMPEHIGCPSGEVLTDPRYRGQLFVKGMYVGTRKAGSFGLNFYEADIDRDRRMISDVESKTTELLAEAMNKGYLVTAVYEMLNEGADMYGLSYRLSDAASGAIADEFLREHPGAIPVASEDEAKDLEHLGQKAVRLPYTLRTIIQRKTGTAADAIKRLRRSAKHTYSLSELTANEAETLQMAIGFVSRAQRKLGESKPVSRAVVVDFSDEDLLGTYSTEDGEVRLARKVLSSRAKAIITLVHEAAHKHGLDGDKKHSDTMQELAEKILEELV